MKNIQRLLIGLVTLLSFSIFGATTPTLASDQSQVVGHWAIPTEGGGGHGGGALYSDGTGGADGFVNLFLAGQHEQGKTTNVTWAYSSDSTPQNPKIDLSIKVEPLSADSDPLGIFAHPFVFTDLQADGSPYKLVTARGSTINVSVSIRQ